MANIWVRKPIAVLLAEAQEGEFGSVPGEPGLRRTLSLWSLVALGIGCIIGAAIFVLTGHAAAAHAGPAISLSYVLAGIVCGFAGLCYAEMASTVPVAGSAYTYAYATMGEFIACVIGWDLILEYAFGATTVAIGWSGYFTSFLRDIGMGIPAEFASTPLAYDPVAGTLLPTGALVNLPAVFVILMLTALLVIGKSAKVNNIIVVIKLTIVVLFILAGVWFVKTSNWVTASNPTGAFIPLNIGPGQYGWSGIVRVREERVSFAHDLSGDSSRRFSNRPLLEVRVAQVPFSSQLGWRTRLRFCVRLVWPPYQSSIHTTNLGLSFLANEVQSRLSSKDTVCYDPANSPLSSVSSRR